MSKFTTKIVLIMDNFLLTGLERTEERASQEDDKKSEVYKRLLQTRSVSGLSHGHQAAGQTHR
uniref:Uncharacterized protein n=1 Tax=Seriola dumerili TaxID=41447 RepID=A0A3B4TDS9_SERDU